MSGPSEHVSIADREIATRKRRDEAQAILESLPPLSREQVEQIVERERALRNRVIADAVKSPRPPTAPTDNPDCDGLSFEEVEARIADHSLPRPTVRQLSAYMRERQRRREQEFAGGIPMGSDPQCDRVMQERVLHALATAILDRAFRRKLPSLRRRPENGS